MSLAIILTLFVVVISLVTLWIKKKFSYWRDRDFPHVEGKFPFGSMAGVGFSKHFSEVSKEIYEKFKGKTKAVGIFFSVAPTLLLLDLDLIKNVLVKDFNNFADRGIYLNAESDPLSAHLFAMEGEGENWIFLKFLGILRLKKFQGLKVPRGQKHPQISPQNLKSFKIFLIFLPKVQSFSTNQVKNGKQCAVNSHQPSHPVK